MRLTGAHILDVRRELWHQCITLTTLAVVIEDMLQAVWRDLDEVNMLVTLKLSLVGFTIPRDLVNMVRGNAKPPTIAFPEPDLVKRDAHQAWLPMLLRPVTCVINIVRSLHVANGSNLAESPVAAKYAQRACSAKLETI